MTFSNTFCHKPRLQSLQCRLSRWLRLFWLEELLKPPSFLFPAGPLPTKGLSFTHFSTASHILYWKGIGPYETKRTRLLNKTKCLIKNVKWTAEGQMGHIWPEGSMHIPIKKRSIKSPGGELKTHVMEITSFRAPLPESLSLFDVFQAQDAGTGTRTSFQCLVQPQLTFRASEHQALCSELPFKLQAVLWGRDY